MVPSLDSTIDNGYAFDDRYDMALSQGQQVWLT